MKHQCNVPDDWSEKDLVNLAAFLNLPNSRAHIKKVLDGHNLAAVITRIALGKPVVEDTHGNRRIEEAITSFRTRDTQSSRLIRWLRESSVETLGQLSRLTVAEFLRIPNLGQKSLQLAYDLLRYYGFDPKWKLV